MDLIRHSRENPDGGFFLVRGMFGVCRVGC